VTGDVPLQREEHRRAMVVLLDVAFVRGWRKSKTAPSSNQEGAAPGLGETGISRRIAELCDYCGAAPESSGFDVAIVRDGFIVELYTVLTDHAR